ncbi:MAG: reverse transcriptase-like protein [Planctomycetota bacterium]
MTPARTGGAAAGGSLEVIVYIDGGSRGNPGPAAAGVVVTAADDGTVLHEAGHFIGRATNNVAEYRGLLAGLEAARKLGASGVAVRSDSELLVRQMQGIYRVKNAGLIPLFQQARTLCQGLKKVSFTHVPREQNTEADGLVNRALDLKRNVEDAAVGD